MSDLNTPGPIFALAARNTRRNTRRTLLTVTAVTVAVMATVFALAYIEGILGNVLDTFARTQSGHVRITDERYPDRERFMPLHLNVSSLSDLLPVIHTHPGVEAALPRIRAGVLVDFEEQNEPSLMLGIDIQREAGYLDPAGMLTSGSLPSPERPEVMVGEGLAERLGIAVGDTITLLGQTAYRSVGGLGAVVSGIGSSGIPSLDRSIVILPLEQAQYMTYLEDGATEILVFTSHPEQEAVPLASSLQEELDSILPGELTATSYIEQGSLMRMMESSDAVFGILLLIILAMAGLIILNTMLMSVMERTREFGMMAAMGMRRGEIVSLILAEGLVIGTVGAAAGGALGSAFALWLERIGIDVTSAMSSTNLPFQGVVHPDWQLGYLAGGVVLGVITAVAATLYPAWKAVRQQPAESLRA
ncbi:MAG: FtsX-like permease family protein [bacterium]